MRSFLLFLIALLAAASAAPDACAPFATSEVDCLKALDSSCNWCAGPAGGAAPVCTSNPKAFPSGTCGSPQRTDCDAQTTNATCSTLVACSWCLSRAVQPECRNYLNASHLPHSVFSCQLF